ncbi:lysophospholipid acyltransferase family protein [Algiphilus sp. W345]|uniref:Lysophospholipid acyltransferase family protein n=1 Tax=Banduia mediterranea TaxID=3075609 RepID=A0ABU2WHV6_9GAMM|nr:lysophospholipid acyltransferase family protein [Algiphilus sp. W345]MDT0497140.1 lysophospholipid acyltransferase family protein [Algiphilus sp. W345]
MPAHAMQQTSLKQKLTDRFVSAEIQGLLARVPKPLGSFGYDPWGYNEDAIKLGVPPVRWLYEHYFRVVAHGLENIPAQGRVLIVPNHSGQLPMDGLLIGYSMLTNPHGPRAGRAMIERFFPTVPWLGNWLNAIGGVIGDPVNCGRMLEREEAVVVFPEGIRGSGKLYRDRYQLQRFGNGFMHLALQHNAPIVPVGVVGCEETMPSLFNISPLARLLGVPYVPIAPPLPLPARVILNFGEPMRFECPVQSEDEVLARVDMVKKAIGGLIRKGLKERKKVF